MVILILNETGLLAMKFPEDLSSQELLKTK